MNLIPILLGGDLNCYSMALAFYEAGVRHSVGLGRYRLGITAHSRFVRQVIDARMESDMGRLAAIRAVKERYPNKRAVLIGCTDEYANFLIREKMNLGEDFLIPSPPLSVLAYADKTAFGKAMEARGIPTPETVYLIGEDSVPSELPFRYPAVLKPTSSEKYWKHPFLGMRKVYFPKSRDEAERIRKTIRAAGYRGILLLQEYIPSYDTDNYVLTTYSDSRGRVVGAAFGRVLREEHTPKGLGNPAAILTERLPHECRSLLEFLEEVGYRGFANFDFIRHPQNKNLYVLEMNLRQGRSNHYMTAAGLNPAGLVISDCVMQQRLPFREAIADVFWHSVPLEVVYSGVRDGALLRHLQKLVAVGRAVSPFYSREELRGNPLRRLFVFEHERRVRKRASSLARE